MKVAQLDYELPSELIAQQPAAVRSASRLLVMDRAAGHLLDSCFRQLGTFLRPGDCLVLNDTKVLPARFFARRRSGGHLEGLFLGATATPDVWEVMLKGAGKLKSSESIVLLDREQHDFCAAEVQEKESDGVCLLRIESVGYALHTNTTDTMATVCGAHPTWLDHVGFPPLPPYIRRDHDLPTAEKDRLRYQTVYARQAGAVAAPTAGLHFTEELIQQLEDAGVRFACVTLHVGAGTFKPITVDNVEEHRIHREWYRIDAGTADTINAVRQESGRIVAVGTTVTRVLETVAAGGRVEASEGTTALFITPGYEFKAVDALITNFHLPRSTLLALVSAFAGLENTLAAYRHAIEQRYRFYSYGDAMLIL